MRPKDTDKFRQPTWQSCPTEMHPVRSRSKRPYNTWDSFALPAEMGFAALHTRMQCNCS